jgi:secreted Zn-dependent insulinase-like peptidase
MRAAAVTTTATATAPQVAPAAINLPCPVPNNPLPPSSRPCLSVSTNPQHRGLLVRVVPIKDTHTLELTWDIPPTEALYRQAPTNYLSHLLGHEGAGSAFALLKARGLATALSAGVLVV